MKDILGFEFTPRFTTPARAAPATAPTVQQASTSAPVPKIDAFKNIPGLQGLFSLRAPPPFAKLELKDGKIPATVLESEAGAVARDLQQQHRTDTRVEVREYSPATERLAKMAVTYRLGKRGIDTLARPKMVTTLSSLALERYEMSTVKDYTNSCLRFERHCTAMGCPLFPLDVFELAACLCIEGERLNLESKSASSVDNLMSGVGCFVNIAGDSAPKEDPFVAGALEAVRRHLGYKNVPKDTLLPEHISKMVELRGGADADLGAIATLARLSVGQVALLRFSDIEALKFGYFVFGPEIVRLFLPRTKTDKYAKGQWASFFVNENDSSSPYALVNRMLAMLVETWDLMSPVEKRKYSKWTDSDGSLLLAEIPFMFKTVSVAQGKRFPAPPGVSSAKARDVLYNMFLADVKDYAASIDLDSTKYATHSCRRGGATSAVEEGVEDELIMEQGRWRSKSAFNRYICDELALRKRAAAFRAVHLGGSTKKHSSELPGESVPLPEKKKRSSKEVLALAAVPASSKRLRAAPVKAVGLPKKQSSIPPPPVDGRRRTSRAHKSRAESP